MSTLIGKQCGLQPAQYKFSGVLGESAAQMKLIAGWLLSQGNSNLDLSSSLRLDQSSLSSFNHNDHLQ